jgi:hypothetical protein
MRRALAIIAVVMMIVFALWVRSRTQAENQRAADERARATLYCVKELEPVCESLRANDNNLTVVTEDAGRTLATLTSADFNPSATKVDGWLAPSTYVDQVNDIRSRGGLEPVFDPPGRVVARSPVVAVMWSDRVAALTAKCGGQVTWKCVGDQAGARWSDIGGNAEWGDVRPVVPAVATSATGLLDVAGAAGSFFGNSSYATNDFTDPTFQEWLQRLADATTGVSLSKPTPLDQMLFAGPSSLDLAGSIEASAAPAVTTSRDKDRLTILYPSPVVSADIVLAPSRGAEPGGRLKDVIESDDAARILAQNGWRVNGQPLAAGLSTTTSLPDANGLPVAGVMEALTTRWRDASR